MPTAPLPVDYHLHSSFSKDCDVPLAERCERAIALGLREIAVTDHADFIPADPTSGYLQPDAALAEIASWREAYAGRLTLRAGVEVGEPHRFPAETAALLAGRAYDVVLGSVHWVGDEWVLGSSYFEARPEREAYEAYFAELLAMVRGADIDVVAHLDVVKRAGYVVYGGFASGDWQEPIRAVLRAAIERGIALEINTGTARRAVNEPSPDLEVLRWYRELGGELLTVGSDAHRAEHLAYDFARAAELVRTAGFRALTGYAARRPFAIDLG